MSIFYAFFSANFESNFPCHVATVLTLASSHYGGKSQQEPACSTHMYFSALCHCGNKPHEAHVSKLHTPYLRKLIRMYLYRQIPLQTIHNTIKSINIKIGNALVFFFFLNVYDLVKFSQKPEQVTHALISSMGDLSSMM